MPAARILEKVEDLDEDVEDVKLPSPLSRGLGRTKLFAIKPKGR